LLVRAPITKGLNDSYTNNQAVGNYMRSKGRYTDFNGKLPLDDSLHFYDATHLNREGVKIFNRSVLDLIVRNVRIRKGNTDVSSAPATQ
jgi:hypothetical protein